MKNLLSSLLILTALALLASCSHYETYAEQKEKETKAIRQYIIDKNINVISEATFNEQNQTTDVSKNEYVLFASSGVYMQIVRKGKMSVRRSSDTFTASFIAGESVMYSQYKSASVPAGWLAPLLYINVGRPEKEGDEIAKVNIIVPAAQGTVAASESVYPCFYTITYEKGI